MYSLKHLWKFQNNALIHEYKSDCHKDIYKYGFILQEVEKCLSCFLQHNIRKHVGIAIDTKQHSVESVVLLLGTLNHECHFFNLDFEGTKGLEGYLEASGVTYLILKDVNLIEHIGYKICGRVEILQQLYFIGELESYTESELMRNINICYTISTSGSTDSPKIVHVPYECIEPNIGSLCSILQINEDDVILLGSPPTFDPFVVEFFMALEKGAALLITNQAMRFNPSAKLLQEVTVWQTTPSLFQLLGKELIRDVIFHPSCSLRSLLLGGEPFPPIQEVQSWLPEGFQYGSKRIFNIYGITEVSCWATIYEYHPSNENVTLGKPLDDLTQLRIIDEADDSVVLPSTGSCKGELVIGSYVRRCLIPQYDEDEKSWNCGDIIYRKTGDIVERDVEGNLYYIGRANNCIKRLGKRLCLDSLAKKIETLLKHKTVCLWQEEHNKLIVCLLLNHTNEVCNKPNIQSLLKGEHFNEFEQPDQVIYVDNLPLNNHGKVNRSQLMKDILKIHPDSRQSPLDIFQNFLVNIMGIDREFLQRNRFEGAKRMKYNLDVGFTAAGGTSFQALSLATEIGELLLHPEEHRKLLEMLLSSEKTLHNIIDFLCDITPVLHKSKKVHKQEAVDVLSSDAIKLLWRTDLKKCVDSSPSLLEESCVTVGSHSRLLLTVNAETGAEISRIELQDRIECSVVFVSSDLAIVGCYDGHLYGFNFRNGSILWKINVNGMIKAKPLLLDDLIIVASYAEDFNIQAFDVKTLKSVWRVKLGSKGIFSSPIRVGANLALVCSLDGSYALIETASGAMRWQKKLESPIFSTPAVQLTQPHKALILAEVKGKITVCNPDNGEEITCFQVAGNVFSSITLCQTNKSLQNILMVFGCHDGNVYCLNYDALARQLSVLWKYSLNAAVYSTPIQISDKTILACSTKGLIVLLDIATAKCTGCYDVKAEIFSTPCFKQSGYIYVGSRDNFLYAFKALSI